MKRAITSEGDVAWVGFHDRERDVDCQFQTAADGMLRCLPESATQIGPFDVRYFADAGCSDPVYAVNAACPRDYLLVSEPDETNPCALLAYRVYERGAAYAGNTYSLSGTSCLAATPGDDKALYRPGAEHPVSEYAAGHESTWGSGRIGTDGVENDEGLRYARGYRDTMLDLGCSFVTLGNGQEYCVELASTSGYSDASCSEAVIYSRHAECGTKPASYSLNPARSGVCDENPALIKIGAPYTGPRYVPSSGMCAREMSSGIEGLYYGVHAELAELPAAEHTTVMDDPGRMKPAYRTRSDGGCWFDAWYDGALDVRCHFRTAADGKGRCFPEVGSGNTLVGVFTDTACTKPAPYLGLSPCEAATLGKLMYDSEIGPQCELVTPRRLIGTPIARADLPQLYVIGGPAGACQPWSPEHENYIAVGARVALSELMGGDVSVE